MEKGGSKCEESRGESLRGCPSVSQPEAAEAAGERGRGADLDQLPSPRFLLTPIMLCVADTLRPLELAHHCQKKPTAVREEGKERE